MLEFREVCKFNLKNINFKVEKGEWLTIQGHGGAGKTTILKLAYGLLKPDNGTILLFDKELNRLPPRKKIGFIPQEEGVFNARTVIENVTIPLMLIRRYNAKAVLSVLENLGLKEYSKINASALPASRRQLLKIAISVVKRPLLLLADEPTEHLDPELGKKVLSCFQELNLIGTTIVFTTSKDIPAFSTREIHIKNGELLI